MGEFASHAQSNLNTVLGSIGTAGALMGGLLNLGDYTVDRSDLEKIYRYIRG